MFEPLPNYDAWKTTPPEREFGETICPDCGTIYGEEEVSEGEPCFECGSTDTEEYENEPDWDSMPGGADWVD